MPEASGSSLSDESDYSIFENKTGLAEDMKFLASMPELCDVTFLVGDTREPICAVKAVLAARSRVFQKMFYQAPSPQRKKEPPPRENKLRVFLKRSSEPLLNLQNAAQQPNQHHTVIIEEFEPDVFRQLIEYIHTGCVTLQPRTLLGLMNAADYYGLDQLRKACTGFIQCCITVDTVCALLASAERYIQYKCTKSLVQKVLEFVDEHGNEVLNLGSFTLLPQHVVRLILAREELRADEFTKFQAALMWSKKYCDSNQNQGLKDVIGNFLEYIQFHKIPANVLMKEVHPLGLVPSGTIVTALAYQADPTSVDPGKLSPHRVKHHDRSLSVQSSLQDPCGSNTSLSSTGSDEGSDDKQHSGKYSTAEQESREEQQWQQKQRDEEEDLQRLIEQRSQFQQMRQEEETQRQEEEEQVRRQEEELRKQEMREEFDKRQKKKEVEATRKMELEEELRKRQEEEDTRKREEEENARKQQEELKKRQQENESNGEEEKLKRQRLDEEAQNEEKHAGNTEEQQRAENRRGQQENEVWERGQVEDKNKQREEQAQQTDENEKHGRDPAGEKLSEEPCRASVVPKSAERSVDEMERVDRLHELEELLKRQRGEEQRRIREERKMQLQLEDLETRWTLQQEMMLRKQEEILRRDIQERRYEEESECRQYQQLQLHIEGSKPEPDKVPEQRVAVARRKSKKRKHDKVEIEVRERESQMQEQQAAPAEGVPGLYIKFVVKREGRANLVWLFKTHRF